MYDEYHLTNGRDVSMEILANPSSSRTSSPFDSQNEDFNVQIEQYSDYVFGNSLDFSDEFDSQTETSSSASSLDDFDLSDDEQPAVKQVLTSSASVSAQYLDLLEDHSDDASGVSDEEHAENDDDLDH